MAGNGPEDNPFSVSRELINTADKRRPSSGGPRTSLFNMPPPGGHQEAPTPPPPPPRAFFTPRPAPRFDPTAASPTTPETGWPAALLVESDHMTPYISSEDGLQHSQAFQQHMRDKKRSAFLMDNVQKKLDTYKTLRSIDPTGFRNLWNRSDVKEYETVEAARWMLMLDYALTMCTTLAVGLWAYQQHNNLYLRWGPALVWLLLQLRAWGNGSTSVFGHLFGLYLVSGEEEQQFVAGGTWAAMAQVAEFVYLLVTCGAGVLASFVMMWVPERGRPAGQRIMGVYVVRETSAPARLARFAPPSDDYPAASTSTRRGGAALAAAPATPAAQASAASAAAVAPGSAQPQSAWGASATGVTSGGDGQGWIRRAPGTGLAQGR